MQQFFNQTLDLTDGLTHYRLWYLLILPEIKNPWGNTVNLIANGLSQIDFLKVEAHPSVRGFYVSLRFERRTRVPFAAKVVVTDINRVEHSFDIVSHGVLTDPPIIDIHDAL